MPVDDEWENEFVSDASGDDQAKTKLDEIEAIPEAVPSKDTTGKHRTLSGFADAVECAREHYRAEGRIYGRKEVFMALKLIRMDAGDHPDAADVILNKLKKWMVENEELLRVAMKD